MVDTLPTIASTDLVVAQPSQPRALSPFSEIHDLIGVKGTEMFGARIAAIMQSAEVRLREVQESWDGDPRQCPQTPEEILHPAVLTIRDLAPMTILGARETILRIIDYREETDPRHMMVKFYLDILETLAERKGYEDMIRNRYEPSLEIWRKNGIDISNAPTLEDINAWLASLPDETIQNMLKYCNIPELVFMPPQSGKDIYEALEGGMNIEFSTPFSEFHLNKITRRDSSKGLMSMSERKRRNKNRLLSHKSLAKKHKQWRFGVTGRIPVNIDKSIWKDLPAEKQTWDEISLREVYDLYEKKYNALGIELMPIEAFLPFAATAMARLADQGKELHDRIRATTLFKPHPKANPMTIMQYVRQVGGSPYMLEPVLRLRGYWNGTEKKFFRDDRVPAATIRGDGNVITVEELAGNDSLHDLGPDANCRPWFEGSTEPKKLPPTHA